MYINSEACFLWFNQLVQTKALILVLFNDYLQLGVAVSVLVIYLIYGLVCHSKPNASLLNIRKIVRKVKSWQWETSM